MFKFHADRNLGTVRFPISILIYKTPVIISTQSVASVVLRMSRGVAAANQVFCSVATHVQKVLYAWLANFLHPLGWKFFT